jgi:hypothetical protein
MSDHCKGVTKRYPLSTAGGIQELRVIAEPDVLRLIVNCTLPAAERFERLVFEEILPSIRKTGSYSSGGQPAESDRHPAYLFKSFMVAGVQYGDALNIARELLGLSRLAAPKEPVQSNQGAEQVPAPLSGFYTVDYLAKVRGLTVSGMKGLLSRRGYQAYDQHGRYVLTDSGRKFGRMTGKTIVWDVRVLETI